MRHTAIGWIMVGLLAVYGADAFAADDAADHVAQARTYYGRGLLDKAAEELGIALKINPANVDAHMRLGTVYLDQGSFKEAMSAFKRVVELRPDDAEGHVWLGTAYRLEGEFNDAVLSLKKAVAINPAHAKAHYILGITYLDMGDEESVRKQHDILIGINQRYAGMLMEKLKGAAYQKGGQR